MVKLRRYALHQSYNKQTSEKGTSTREEFVLVVFLVPDLRFGDAAAQLVESNSMALLEPRGNKGQVAGLVARDKVIVVIIMDRTDKTKVYNDLPSKGQHKIGEIYNGRTH